MNTKSITVSIPVSDLDEGMAWNRRLIGTTEERAPAPGVWECRIMPSVWLQLFEQPGETPNPTVVRFESDQIEVDRDRVERLSADVAQIETVPGAVRYFEFRDPFGNQLSFYEVLEDRE